MRITLLAVGSRGDVQPVLALALALGRAGHEVRLATHAAFRELALAHGVHVHVLGGLSIDALMSDMTAGAGARSGGRLFREFRRGMHHIRAGMAPLLDDCLQAIEGAEAVGFSPQLLPLAGTLKETGVTRLFCTALQPVTPTAVFPSPFLGSLSLGPWLNRASYTLPARLFWPVVGGEFNAWRKRSLGLAPVSAGRAARWLKAELPVLYGFSPQVVPRPRDWDASRVLCGYWRLPAAGAAEPTGELAAFLAAGDAPVVVGFGSMADEHAETTLASVLQAIEGVGRRAVIQTPLRVCGGRSLPEWVFRAGELDHESLFPRSCAVIHHCGAGTAAAVLHAGRPSVTVPWAFEQPWWARRLETLGVAPPAVARHGLDGARLGRALELAIGNTAFAVAAGKLGGLLGKEDGLSVAVRTVERLFGQ
jgi:sterol 3beta-glucosyltransferase